MSRRQRANPFDQGSAERVLFDRYRRATAAAQAAERAELLAHTEAASYRDQANRYAEALRALGHGDKVPRPGRSAELLKGLTERSIH